MIRIMETNNNDARCLNEVELSYAIHPGSVLGEELKSRGVKQVDFAKRIGMEPSHLSALIHGVRNITAVIADRLEKGLDIPASFWMNLQATYNLDKKRLHAKVGTSGLVDGYSAQRGTMPALAEQESAVYGEKGTALVRFPKKDLSLLKEICSRFGWDLE